MLEPENTPLFQETHLIQAPNHHDFSFHSLIFRGPTIYQCSSTSIPSLKLTWHLKMDGWNTSFLLGWPIFRCYMLVSGSVYTKGTARPKNPPNAKFGKLIYSQVHLRLYGICDRSQEGSRIGTFPTSRGFKKNLFETTNCL